ncbi:unnamed protein product (macronuclear) [Paramecium tetraurelia]|uniref:RING-type E3 ubiquitin transferase n=1 Tax=Paramecium tetraurelia TaxID=5888 RepID=A0BGX1_PARTE|nr:uncharacterized protein GSPATT00028823001 [Paramecium tetraurelia]CAK57788.1 unnamed protein product [Paramecium tetraurelia]|eukprot:XP_001425186.1 hypothetical protein (macronuclear) [Paramecium tetraurelia strain d4-2]
MSVQGLIKTGVVLANALLLTGGYVIYKRLYTNYLKFKKESKRLADGGKSDYQYLIDALNKEGKEGPLVQVNDISFIGTSEQLTPTSYVHSKVNKIQKFICVKGTLHEYNKDIIQTQWVKAFNLKDQNNHNVLIHVTNKDSFVASLFQKVLPPSENDSQIENVKEAFSVKVTEEGIAFGSSLYVFGNFIKNKLGQIQCAESNLICKAVDAKDQTQTYSYVYLFGAACVVTCCLLISGISLYLTFEQSEEKQNKVGSKRR